MCEIEMGGWNLPEAIEVECPPERDMAEFEGFEL